MATRKDKTNEEQKQSLLAGIVDKESKTFTFKFILTVDGEKKEGTFVAKYLSVATRLRLGTIRAKLLDGAPVQSLDTLTDDMSYIMAYLTVAFINKPTWFDFERLEDISEMRDLYTKVYNWMSSFRRKDGQDTNAGNSPDASGPETVEDM